jgi:hypothetical protein
MLQLITPNVGRWVRSTISGNIAWLCTWNITQYWRMRSLLVYLTTLYNSTDYTVSNGGGGGAQWWWTPSCIAGSDRIYLKVLHQDLSWGVKENHENPRYIIFKLQTENRTRDFLIRRRSANYSFVRFDDYAGICTFFIGHSLQSKNERLMWRLCLPTKPVT